jgi:hypothetical protein
VVEKIQDVDRNLGLCRVVLVDRAALDAGDDGGVIDGVARGLWGLHGMSWRPGSEICPQHRTRQAALYCRPRRVAGERSSRLSCREVGAVKFQAIVGAFVRASPLGLAKGILVPSPI